MARRLVRHGDLAIWNVLAGWLAMTKSLCLEESTRKRAQDSRAMAASALETVMVIPKIAIIRNGRRIGWSVRYTIRFANYF